MTDVPDPIRRAMEAAARRGKLDVGRVLADLQDPEVIPSDEDEVGLEDTHRATTPRTDASEEGGGFPRAALLEQPSLLDQAPVPIRYENLLPEADVLTYKRVKRWTMALATDAREIIAGIVGGTIGDGGRSKKEFLQTRVGKYRVSMSYNSDNTTEVAAHLAMGVTTIHLSDPAEVLAFFQAHDVPAREAYDLLVRQLQGRFRT
jgi:hypothetical protein